jgi:methylglutaconyl-CoA hydratase
MADRKFETILAAEKGKVFRVTMNRPRVHNAFNSKMIEELTEAFDLARRAEDVRIVILTGAGESFCAGADLNWMREIIHYSYEQNLRESLQVAELMKAVYELPKPTLARINGAVIGGGTGLLSACDIVVASDKARFGLSEVKIGLVPAAIGPYVIRRIGESAAHELFLTGERFGAQRALEIGLVNKVVPHPALDAEVDELVGRLLSSGPDAIAKCKELLQKVPGMNLEQAKGYTAEMIARLRISPEGQEGMASFLEKRKPRWAKE